MTPNDIQAAFEARQSAVHQLRELADETRDREMTGEETSTIEKINADIDALDSSIDVGLRNLEREHKATEALETFRSYNDITTPAVENAVDPSTDDQTLFRQLVDGEIRSFTSHASEQRDQTKGSATAGGNLVDSTMFSRIFEKLEEQSMVIAAGATVINTASGEDLLVPKVTTNPTGALVTEGSRL
jgi:HK97 family phage major capsid protein